MYVFLPLFERLYRDVPVNEGKACKPETKLSFGLVLSILVLFILLSIFFYASPD